MVSGNVDIERLEDRHRINEFGCGISALNHFLKQRARFYQSIGYSVTHVAVEPGSDLVLGYVSVSASCIQVGDFGDEIADRLKVHEFAMPTLHVGRFAVAKKLQGRGIGEKLLNYAIDIATDGTPGLGISAVDLWLENERLVHYYSRFGFTAIKPGSGHFYLPLGTILSADEIAAYFPDD